MGKGKAIAKEISMILRYGGNIAGGIAAQWKSKVGIKSHLTLDEMVAHALGKTGSEKCNLVGHSFGGLTSMVYALENPEKVQNCIMIGTPFYGTNVAYLSFAFLALGVFPAAAKQITPNNEFLRKITEYFTANAFALPTRFHNFRSIDDELVPADSSKLKHLALDAANVYETELSGEGHGSLVYCEPVYRQIVKIMEENPLPTLFAHGFAMDKNFFRKTLQRMQDEGKTDCAKLAFSFSYDYTKPIKAVKISEWYVNNGPAGILSKDLVDY